VDSFNQFVHILESPMPAAFLAVILMLLFSAFLKISLVFGFLRVGLGIDSFGGTFLTAGISLALAWFVMYPTFEKTFGTLPGDCKENTTECLTHVSNNWKSFVTKETSPEDKKKFIELASKYQKDESLSEPEDEGWNILGPAFILSEIKSAFSIGIKILLPFLVIDLLIGYLFAALSVTTLSATALSFPLKILAFTALDGWSLVVENLLRGILGS
jgi:flagellar biosynthesis protein FliP